MQKVSECRDSLNSLECIIKNSRYRPDECTIKNSRERSWMHNQELKKTLLNTSDCWSGSESAALFLISLKSLPSPVIFSFLSWHDPRRGSVRRSPASLPLVLDSGKDPPSRGGYRERVGRAGQILGRIWETRRSWRVGLLGHHGRRIENPLGGAPPRLRVGVGPGQRFRSLQQLLAGDSAGVGGVGHLLRHPDHLRGGDGGGGLGRVPGRGDGAAQERGGAPTRHRNGETPHLLPVDSWSPPVVEDFLISIGLLVMGGKGRRRRG